MASKKGRGSGKRQHTYKRPKDRSGARFTGSHHCPDCGKWACRTRDDAEAAARYFHPGIPMRFYKCEKNNEWWHYTSMSADKIARYREQRAVTDDEEDDQV